MRFVLEATESTTHRLSPHVSITATISRLGSSISHSASESFAQSLNRFFGLCCGGQPADSCPYSSRLGMRSSSSRRTWPFQQSQCRWMCASMLIVFAFSNTYVSGAWVVQWICTYNWSLAALLKTLELFQMSPLHNSCFTCVSETCQHTCAVHFQLFVLVLSLLCDHTRLFRAEKASVAFFRRIKLSHSQVPEQKRMMVLPWKVNLLVTLDFLPADINGRLSVHCTWGRLEHQYCLIKEIMRPNALGCLRFHQLDQYILQPKMRLDVVYLSRRLYIVQFQ